MAEENTYDEFEVSFDFENVLYIGQVKIEGSPANSFYKVQYFSPNKMGTIDKLAARSPADGTEHTEWSAMGAKEDPLFVQALGNAIEKRP